MRLLGFEVGLLGSFQLGEAVTGYELVYFVDDVVREHFQRDRRVRSELLQEIERLQMARVSAGRASGG
ncbi:MAG: hypothetical protein JXA74_09405 [Anaerolineae bacterium]|nr:hypothetical protein [Anaerolineae bacterium]